MSFLNFLKPIPGLPDYFASHSGGIISKKFGRRLLMKTLLDINGYKTCTLGRKVLKVHRLVALAWIPNPENLPVVDHLNGDRTCNNVDNLEWVTVGENNRRARRKLSFPKYMKSVVRTTLECKYIERYESIAEAARKTGTDPTSISHALKKKYKTAGGFKWFYESEFNGEQSKTMKEPKDWDILAEYPGYRISKTGEVYSMRRKRLLIQTNKSSSKNYFYIGLVNKKKENVSVPVHRLVARTYIPRIPGKNWVNHIDGNKRNNNVENLEWCTPKENAIHAHNIGLIKTRKIVICSDQKGNEVVRYKSLREASSDTNLCYSSISRASRGEYKKLLNGLIWRYE